MLHKVNRALQAVTGFKFVRGSGWNPPDFDENTIEIIRRVGPFTMTSRERIDAICRAVDYVVSAGVPGAFVECGVWKGGSAMAAALRFLHRGDARHMWLYDTFEGSPDPGEDEVDPQSMDAQHFYRQGEWLYAGRKEVEDNLASTGYDMGRVRFVQGLVEDTIPQDVPENIAVLRLDTDFHDSTWHELKHLVPLVSPGGLLIIDDYGHWSGAKRAVDEYFNGSVFFARIDYSARVAVLQLPESARANATNFIQSLLSVGCLSDAGSRESSLSSWITLFTCGLDLSDDFLATGGLALQNAS